MTRLAYLCLTILIGSPLLASDLAAQSETQKIRVESADQLPRHSYPVPESATALVEDDAQFAALAEKLETDLKADLARYEIGDRATLKEYYGTLGSLALIEGDHETALAYTDSVRAIEDKPALKALTGTLERAIAAAAQAPEDDRSAVFEEAYRKEITALPYDEIQAELKSRKGMAEMSSPGLLLGWVQGQVGPAAESGEISRDLANIVVSTRKYMKVIQPVLEPMIRVLDETIAAHTVEKPDIWAAREVSLEGRADLSPVVIGIWDSGVDVALYEERLFVNEDEIPDNREDDDGNGFVDDVHGIAHDLLGERTTGVLLPLTYGQDEEARYRRYLKGFMDLQAGLDTPDASQFKQLAAAIDPDEVRPFFEGFFQYSNYAHGTHVAGIAAAGNPAARILVGRITFDHRMVPELPTIELAEGWVKEARESVEYFRDHHVRVVNMSRGFFPQYFENALEANNAGGSAEERKALARRIHDISAAGFREAIADAPEILFVAAAGNEDEDNRFTDWAPASFDLPNMITAAAVDQAGDEAAFTSYGKVEVYANGYEVESDLPGGERSPLSGTSMAAPQVVNLAAKLWAVYPDLTVAQVREAILGGADEKTIGEDKVIKLLNPKRSFEIVEDAPAQPADSSATTQLGTLPRGALGTTELAGVRGEIVLFLLVDPALVAGRIPPELDTSRLRRFAASDSTAARYLAAHPERAEWLWTMLAFASLDSVSEGRSVPHPPVNEAFWWVWTRPVPELDARALGMDWAIELAWWVDDPERARYLQGLGSSVQHGRVLVEPDDDGQWRFALEGPGLSVSATCRLEGERAPEVYPLPAYTTLWEGGAELDFFTVFAYHGHHSQPCSAEWSSDGAHPLAQALRAVTPEEMAEFPGTAMVQDGWRARGGFYRRQ